MQDFWDTIKSPNLNGEREGKTSPVWGLVPVGEERI
jgi:hypothetical protein